MTNQPKSFGQLSLVQQSFPEPSKLSQLAVSVVADRDAIAHADIEDTLRSIARRFDKMPMRDRALDLYTNNRILLLGNKDTVKVPTVLPGWRIRSTRGYIVAYVNAVPYMPASGAGSMDARKLFGLLSLGAALVDSHDNWAKVTNSGPMAKALAAVYSRMMHKVADKITGAGMDRMRSDQLKYVFAKYLLVGMMGRPAGETTDAIAAEQTAGTARAALVEFENSTAAAVRSTEGAAVTNQTSLYQLGLMEFLDAVGRAAPWAGRMSPRGFVQTFVGMYGAPSLLAAEELGFLLGILATHQAGAEIAPSFTFDPIYGREGDDAVAELARLVR